MSLATQSIAVLIACAIINPSHDASGQDAVAEQGPPRRPYKPFVQFTLPEFTLRSGHGPDHYARFLADYFTEEPYTGAVRGTRAVLVTRAGNSLDLSRFLLGLLKSRGPEGARLVSFGRNGFPTRDSNVIAAQAAVITAVENSALLDAVALGDAMDAAGRIKPQRPQTFEREYQRYGVQIREGETWRTIYGGTHNQHSRAVPIEMGRIAESDVTEISLRIDVVYSTPQQRSSETLNVFNTSLVLEEVVFRPLWLALRVSEESVKVVLHGVPNKDGTQRTISGSDFPLSGLSGRQSQNVVPNAPEGLIEDIRLTVTHGGREPLERSFSLKPQSAEDPSTDWRPKFLRSLHVLSVATGTPSIDYLIRAVEDRGRGAERSVAVAFHAIHMAYLVLRDQSPASPYRSDVQRVLTGPNVFTTSIFVGEAKSSADEVVVNLASKRYELMDSAGSASSFGDNLWNGFLDYQVENLLATMLDDAHEPVCAADDIAPRQFQLVGHGQPLPSAVSAAQAEQLKQRMAHGVVVAYHGALGGQPPAQYWVIELDGKIEDWNRWDRHQPRRRGWGLTQVAFRAPLRKLRASIQCALFLGITALTPQLIAEAKVTPASKVLADIAKGMVSGTNKANSQRCRFQQLAEQLGKQGGSSSRPKRRRWW